MKGSERNKPCPCGFGRKAKHCCEQYLCLRGRRAPQPADGVAFPWCGASDVLDAPIPWADLVAAVSDWSIPELLPKLAAMLSMLQNSENPSENLLAWSRLDLEGLRAAGQGLASRVAGTILFRWDLTGQRWALATEKGLLLTVALVLAHGSVSGRMPSHDEIVWLQICVNDYASTTSDENAPLGQAVAEFAHVQRFNRHPDFLREMARSSLILSQPPQTRADLQGEAWLEFQRKAFSGIDFEAYSQQFLGPLAVLSGQWMSKSSSAEAPVIDPSRWGVQSRAGPKFCAERFAELSISLESAASSAREALAGDVKKLPSFMFRTPLVAVGDKLVAIAPSLVQGQLHLGVWGRCLNAAKNLPGGTGRGTLWHEVFGILFDQYVEWVVQQAAGVPGFAQAGFKLIGRAHVGSSDEIEDVVLSQASNVLLGSCKAGLAPEVAIRQAADPDAYRKWLERLFFDEGKDGHRRGAAHLLNEKVIAVQEGRHEPRLSASSNIFPLFILYDNLGENPFFLRWLHEECRKRGLFRQSFVNPPVVVDVAVFEAMMSLATHGGKVWRALFGVGRLGESMGSMQLQLHKMVPDGKYLRLEALRERFDAIAERMTANFKDAHDAASPRG